MDDETDSDETSSEETDDELAGMYDNEETDDELAGMYDSEGHTVSASSGDSAGEQPEETPESDESGVPGGEASPMGMDGPMVEAGNSEPETAAGKFYVKGVQETAVTLHEVNTTQIFTLIENPGFEAHDIVEATLIAQPPMEVSYLIDELEAHYQIPVETSPEPPTRQVEQAGEDLDTLEAIAIDREGKGEIHVITVDPEDVEETVEQLHEDEMIYKNAARYEPVERVEIRSDETDGIVSVRYLP